jgi:hypothetical protein
LYFDAELVDIDVPGAELNPQRRLMVRLEPPLGKPQQKARLADTCITP